MIVAGPRIRRGVRPRGRSVALALLWLGAAATAQEPASSPSRPAAQMSASPDRLWVACRASGDARDPTLILSRPAGGAFDLGREVVSTPELQLLLAGRDSLMAWMRDGSVYRYDALSLDRGAPERSLPGRDVPLDATWSGDHVLALISPAAAAALAAAATQPLEFRSAESPQIIEYDGRDWRPLRPAEILGGEVERGRAALAALDDALLLAWTPRPSVVRVSAAARSSIADRSADAARPADWSTAAEFDFAQPVTRVWLTRLGDLPALVVAARTDGGGESIAAFRLLDELGRPDAWRPADLRFSTLPAGPLTYRAAAGFNQQLALLALDASRDSHLIFARPGESPSESTVGIRALVEKPMAERTIQFWATQVTRTLLFVMVIVLFVFRRDSATRVASLPVGEQVALISPRLLAWVIDFAPFALAASQALGLSTLDSLRSLGEWALAIESASVAPSARVLTWWALAVGGHTAYTLVMELLTRRTVGKTLMGLRVRSETGGPAGFWAVLTRNLARPVELFPPFWILGFLVLLSRNRQRIGDIVGRTLIASLRRPRDAAPPDSGDA